MFLNRLERWLRRSMREIPKDSKEGGGTWTYKELGWEEIGEKFTRFILFKCAWFAIYLHKLDAPQRHSQCHDHPWHFWAILLSGGYFEEMNGKRIWRSAGSILYRTARSLHNTITRKGYPNYSIIVVSHRCRKWGMKDCGEPPAGHWLTEKSDVPT